MYKILAYWFKYINHLKICLSLLSWFKTDIVENPSHLLLLAVPIQ